MSLRKKIVAESKRVVVKVGTRLLTDFSCIPVLIEHVAKLKAKGLDVILVSSGAVGMGMKTLELKSRPSELSFVQALASIGQSKLMSNYENAAQKHGFHVAQLLLTATGLSDRQRHLNALNCINSLWAHDVLPVINENDAIAVDELRFGDNDTLAALIATMTKSKLTILLTTVGGLYSSENGQLLDRISVVENIDKKIRSYAGGTDDSSMSIGGMNSKLNAAEIVTSSGDYLWIADGREDNIMDQIMMGEDVGTLFTPKEGKPMQSRKRWISFFSEPTGSLYIDDGAKKALCKKGSSLLPSGLLKVEGSFECGDTVDICDKNGNPFARGLVNYNSENCNKIKGLHTDKISSVLNYVTNEELIHRDNFVIL